MIKIKQAVIVEGKYDKIKLSGIIDAPIIQTDGFGIFKDKELQKMIRILAEKRGILVLTDSDSAGFKIRSFIGSTVDPKYVKNAYIPDIFGKERRKKKGGKEGKLGVEGMSPTQLLDSLRRSGATILGEESPRESAGITSADLMEKGFIGPNSTQRRAELIKKLQLPQHISTKGLLEALNLLLSREEWEQM